MEDLARLLDAVESESKWEEHGYYILCRCLVAIADRIERIAVSAEQIAQSKRGGYV